MTGYAKKNFYLTLQKSRSEDITGLSTGKYRVINTECDGNLLTLHFINRVLIKQLTGWLSIHNIVDNLIITYQDGEDNVKCKKSARKLSKLFTPIIIILKEEIFKNLKNKEIKNGC